MVLTITFLNFSFSFSKYKCIQIFCSFLCVLVTLGTEITYLFHLCQEYRDVILSVDKYHNTHNMVKWIFRRFFKIKVFYTCFVDGSIEILIKIYVFLCWIVYTKDELLYIYCTTNVILNKIMKIRFQCFYISPDIFPHLNLNKILQYFLSAKV